MPVQLHDGSQIVLRKVDDSFDPTDKAGAWAWLEQQRAAGEIVTGLLYLDETQQEMHELNALPDEPLNAIDFSRLCPGNETLQKLQSRFR